MSALELYDLQGEVVDQIADNDSAEYDELDAVLNPVSKDVETPPVEEPKAEVKVETPAEETPPVVPPAEAPKLPETPPEPPVESPKPDAATENAALKAMLKEQEKELAFAKARLEKLEKAIVTDPDEKVIPAKIEELQAEISRVAEEKGPAFDVLLETMEQTDKYADIKQVCTQTNLNYIISEAAEVLAAKENRDRVELALELEAAIWNERNPYKTMYEMIKTYHPSYAKPAVKPVEEPPKPVDSVPKPVAEVKPPVVVPAPSTIAQAGAGTTVTMAGWTAARIDELPEDELKSVPAEVYEKYLQGALD